MQARLRLLSSAATCQGVLDWPVRNCDSAALADLQGVRVVHLQQLGIQPVLRGIAPGRYFGGVIAGGASDRLVRGDVAPRWRPSSPRRGPWERLRPAIGSSAPAGVVARRERCTRPADTVVDLTAIHTVSAGGVRIMRLLKIVPFALLLATAPQAAESSVKTRGAAMRIAIDFLRQKNLPIDHRRTSVSHRALPWEAIQGRYAYFRNPWSQQRAGRNIGKKKCWVVFLSRTNIGIGGAYYFLIDCLSGEVVFFAAGI
jgi:hypothetical protein